MAKRRPRKQVAASVKQKFPNAYLLDTDAYGTLFDGFSVGAELEHLIIDNSVGFGGEVVHFKKMTIQFGWINGGTASQALAILMAVVRDTEDTTPIALDSTSAVRDARNENHLLRGPWMRILDGRTNAVTMGKTIVLHDVTLDQNDDLKMIFTNVGTGSFPSPGPHLFVNLRAWYKKVGA